MDTFTELHIQVQEIRDRLGQTEFTDTPQIIEQVMKLADVTAQAIAVIGSRIEALEGKT